MKPFKPTPEQLEAIAGGATKLWVPIPQHVKEIDLQSNGMISWVVDDTFSNDDIEEFVYDLSPLQLGEQYFAQEEFSSHGDHSKGTVYYIVDHKDKPIDIQQIEHHYGIFPADQMTEAQSRFKFKVTGVEVKQVQELSTENILDLEVLSLLEKLTFGFRVKSADLGMPKAVAEWHDSQYPEQPYRLNPTGFLVSIERIEQ